MVSSLRKFPGGVIRMSPYSSYPYSVYKSTTCIARPSFTIVVFQTNQLKHQSCCAVAIHVQFMSFKGMTFWKIHMMSLRLARGK